MGPFTGYQVLQVYNHSSFSTQLWYRYPAKETLLVGFFLGGWDKVQLNPATVPQSFREMKNSSR